MKHILLTVLLMVTISAAADCNTTDLKITVNPTNCGYKWTSNALTIVHLKKAHDGFLTQISTKTDDDINLPVEPNIMTWIANLYNSELNRRVITWSPSNDPDISKIILSVIPVSDSTAKLEIDHVLTNCDMEL